jgi:hypothetical protein
MNLQKYPFKYIENFLFGKKKHLHAMHVMVYKRFNYCFDIYIYIYKSDLTLILNPCNNACVFVLLI